MGAFSLVGMEALTSLRVLFSLLLFRRGFFQEEYKNRGAIQLSASMLASVVISGLQSSLAILVQAPLLTAKVPSISWFSVVQASRFRLRLHLRAPMQQLACCATRLKTRLSS